MTDAELDGRLAVASKLPENEGLSLSVGSKQTGLADLNIDVEAYSNIDILGDATQLPFEPGTFSTVYFTDVIEHICPPGDQRALAEIYRVLEDGGELILSTPNDRTLYRSLDFSRLVMFHNAYSTDEIRTMLQEVGFEDLTVFTAGNIYAALGMVWYYLVTYPRKRFYGEGSYPNVPQFLRSRSKRAYLQEDMGDRGFTVYARAVK